MKKLSLVLSLMLFFSVLFLSACGTKNETSLDPNLNLPEEEMESSTLVDDPLLTQYKWLWQETEYLDGMQIKPEISDAFIMVLNEDGTMLADTDCNNMFGNFTVDQNSQINFPATASTKMYCEGSQEVEFARILERADKYFFEEDILMIAWENNEAVSSFSPLFR